MKIKKIIILENYPREIIGSFALTEPNAGSDAGNTQTTATLVDDEYIVNGQKVFVQMLVMRSHNFYC